MTKIMAYSEPDACSVQIVVTSYLTLLAIVLDQSVALLFEKDPALVRLRFPRTRATATTG